jgi:hypothetical protein
VAIRFFSERSLLHGIMCCVSDRHSSIRCVGPIRPFGVSRYGTSAFTCTRVRSCGTVCPVRESSTILASRPHGIYHCGVYVVSLPKMLLGCGLVAVLISRRFLKMLVSNYTFLSSTTHLDPILRTRVRMTHCSFIWTAVTALLPV